jgi:hypothetical protein
VDDILKILLPEHVTLNLVSLQCKVGPRPFGP